MNDLELYDRVASQWWESSNPLASLRHLNPHRFKYFDRHIASWNGMKVLDVGCGGGFTTEFIARKGALVSGLDPSKRLIEVATQHARASDLSIDYRTENAESMSFADASFDAVICVDVLEHVNCLKTVVGEIARVTKQGGWFLFDTVNRTFLSRAIMIWLLENTLKEIPRGAHDWKKFIRCSELNDLLRRSGFGEIELAGFTIWGKNRRTGALRIQVGGPKSIMYIGKARKLG